MEFKRLVDLGSLAIIFYILTVSYQIGKFSVSSDFIDYDFLNLSIESMSLSWIEMMHYEGYIIYVPFILLLSILVYLLSKDKKIIKTQPIETIEGKKHQLLILLLVSLSLLPFCFYKMGTLYPQNKLSYIYYYEEKPYHYISSRNDILLLKSKCDTEYKYVSKINIQKITKNDQQNKC